VTTLILPEANRKDYFEEVPADVQKQLKTYFVRTGDEVLKLALEK
jgi:ATP-dependent Lon protease